MTDRLLDDLICHIAAEEIGLSYGHRPGRPFALDRTMHEMSIMQSALAMALEQARQAGACHVHALRLRVGALSGVVPDALQFAFEALAADTLAQGAQLDIEQVPARFWCAVCRREFDSPNLLAQCPDCDNPSGELRAGRELELTSMEID